MLDKEMKKDKREPTRERENDGGNDKVVHVHRRKSFMESRGLGSLFAHSTPYYLG
jgi:hypothetical protein